MQSSLDFLPDAVVNTEGFQKAWRHAVFSTSRALDQDKHLGTAEVTRELRDATKNTMSAATTIRDEIDEGCFADILILDSFASEHDFSENDIQVVRRFLHLLRQDVLVSCMTELASLPTKRKKSARHTAAYFAGRICKQFNLGRPTDYASDSHETESIAVQMIRCLLAEAGADNGLSKSTMRRHIATAREGFDSFRLKTQTNL